MSSLREAVQRDGFARVPGAFTDAVQALRDAMDAVDLPVGPSGYGRIVHDPWRHSAVLAAHLRSGPLPRLAAEVLGCDPVLFQDHLVSKTPGTRDAVKWHQDYSYWPLSSAVGLTMWVALDDADVDNGCLHYVRGSHTDGERAPADFIDAAQLGVQAAHLPPMNVDESRIVAVPARAGDVLVHDPLVLHYSPGNLTERPRRAWSISWVTADARWSPEHAPHPYNWSLAPVAGTVLDPAHFPRIAVVERSTV